MSHVETEIELANGVTVLTGPNNIGKSAVVEAIRSLAENPASQGLIRHGASKAVVTVELDSGEIISWERTHGSPLYRIKKDGREEVYAKIGNNVPEDVRKLLRISPVITGDGEEVNVHIALQKDPIFIPSGSRAASFFAASTEAHYLVQMQQLLKSKADARKARKKEIEAEIVRLRAQIERYAPLDSIQEIFNVVDKLEAEIKEVDEKIPRLMETINSLERLIADLDSLNEQFAVLEKLKDPPLIKPVAPLEALIVEIDSVSEQINMLEDTLKRLESLETPPDLRPTEALAEIADRISLEESLVERLQKADEVLQGLGDPPPLHPSAELAKVIFEIEQLERIVRELSRTNVVLSHLEPAPVLLDVVSLGKMVSEMESLFTSVDYLKNMQVKLSALNPPPELISMRDISALEELIGRLEDMERRVGIGREYYKEVEKACIDKRREIEARLAAIKVCPLCRQPIDVEHFFKEII
jgi:exonuclease SbcC